MCKLPTHIGAGCVSLNKDVVGTRVWRPSLATVSLNTSSNRRWSKDLFGLSTISKTSLGLSEAKERRYLRSLVERT